MPAVLADQAWQNLKEYAELIIELPKQTKTLLNTVQRGKARLEIIIPELEGLLRKLDRIGNQLSFSIILLSFSIIMCGLVVASAVGQEPLIFWRIPAIEAGSIVAAVMFLLLLLSIFRSGRF